MVRRIAPPERFLEFKAEDGWEPHYAFLGKEVPESEYPRIDDSKEFADFAEILKRHELFIGNDVPVAKMLAGLVFVLWILLLFLVKTRSWRGRGQEL